MLSTTVTPQVQITRSRRITRALLNLLGRPLVALSGQASTSQIEDGAVTAAKASFGAWFVAADSGSANAHILTPSPAITAYADGQYFAFKAAASNTTATPTINVSSLGTKTVYAHNGAGLMPGDIVANRYAVVRYNSTLAGFELLSPGALPVLTLTDTSTSATAYTATATPALPAYLTGQMIAFKPATSNTGACTINVNSLGAKSIKVSGSDPSASALVGGSYSLLIYDGTNFQLLNAVSAAVSASNAVGVSGTSRNLVIKTNATNPNYQVDITADEVCLTNGSGVAIVHRTVSLTADISLGTALNGLETGTTETVSTMYYLWLISDGTTIKSVISASSSSPTLGSTFNGYSYKALVGAVFNSSAGNFWAFHQQGNRVGLNTAMTVFSTTAGVTSHTLLTLNGSSITNVAVPASAKVVFGVAGTDDSALSTTEPIQLSAGSGGEDTVVVVGGLTSGAGSSTLLSFYVAGFYRIGLRTAQAMYWKAADTVNSYKLIITGWEY